MKWKTIFVCISLWFISISCCPFIKEEYLGNNFVLSEYDKIDRMILYSEKKCSGSGLEIVPMTVFAYAYNDKWIIARSGSRYHTDIRYWIVNKDFNLNISQDSSSAMIKSHVSGPLDSISFDQKLKEHKIRLVLNEIDN